MRRIELRSIDATQPSIVELAPDRRYLFVATARGGATETERARMLDAMCDAARRQKADAHCIVMPHGYTLDVFEVEPGDEGVAPSPIIREHR